MRAYVLFLSAAALTCGTAFAQQSMTFDWEDGVATVLGTYAPEAQVANSTEQAQSGSHSLKFWEDPVGTGTPQAYIWWITGCVAGDVIDASFYVYDDTPGSYASGRIWAHYTSDPSDVNSYSGSASGNNTYSSGIGWEQLSYSWTYANSGDDEGFVVEARIYSSAGESLIYIDNAYISTTSSTAVIHNAAGGVPVELTSFISDVGEGVVTLTWSTASESDNMGFNILRAVGASARTVLNGELIPGAGTTLNACTYEFVDSDVSPSTTYRYWLEQVDYQGTSEVYGPVVASVPAEVPRGFDLTVSPQPVADGAEIKFQVPRAGEADVMLYDVQGRMVARVWKGIAAGSQVVRWDRNGVPAGLYMLRVATDLGSTGQPVIIR